MTNSIDPADFSRRIIAFDVETPNSYNDRMSAIGVVIIRRAAQKQIHQPD